MKEPTEEQFKKRLINMLNYFNNYCEHKKINYYLMYGSLLGAARHMGMIPWDDDIDLMIPRSDFEKLIKNFNKNNNKYKIISTYTNKNFTAPLAKLVDTETILLQNYGFNEKVELGIYIDLFVFDGMSSDGKKRNKQIKKAIDLTNKWIRANHGFYYQNSSFFKNILRAIKHIPNKIMGYKYYLNQIEKNQTRFNYNESEFVGNLGYLTTNKESFPKSYFEKSYLKFENILCPVPKEYKKILKQLYGDWKKLPPKEKRVSHHSYKCYIKNS